MVTILNAPMWSPLGLFHREGLSSGRTRALQGTTVPQLVTAGPPWRSSATIGLLQGNLPDRVVRRGEFQVQTTQAPQDRRPRVTILSLCPSLVFFEALLKAAPL